MKILKWRRYKHFIKPLLPVTVAPLAAALTKPLPVLTPPRIIMGISAPNSVNSAYSNSADYGLSYGLGAIKNVSGEVQLGVGGCWRFQHNLYDDCKLSVWEE